MTKYGSTRAHPAAAAAAARLASRPMPANACWVGACGHTSSADCMLSVRPDNDLPRGRDAAWMQSVTRVALAGRPVAGSLDRSPWLRPGGGA